MPDGAEVEVEVTQCISMVDHDGNCSGKHRCSPDYDKDSATPGACRLATQETTVKSQMGFFIGHQFGQHRFDITGWKPAGEHMVVADADDFCGQ
jgi:hypothetical protein